MTLSSDLRSGNGSSRRGGRWRLYVVVAVALAAWCAVDVQRRGRLDPALPNLHRTDFTCYTEAGAVLLHGGDPYEFRTVRGWGYNYPPMFALVVAPLHVLHPRLQVSIWFLISVLFVWGCYRECVRIALAFLGATQRSGTRETVEPRFPRWLGWAALAAAALPILNCLQRGQVDVLKLYLLLLGFRLTITGRGWWAWFLGGILFAAAIVLKLTPLLPVGFLLMQLVARRLIHRRQDDERNLGRAAGVGMGIICGVSALLFFVPAVVIGWQANFESLQRFQQLKVAKINDYRAADLSGNTRTLRNQSLSNAVIRLGNFIGYELLGSVDDRLIDRAGSNSPPMLMDNPGVEKILLILRIALIVLLLAVGLMTVARGDALAQAAAFGLACTAALIISPISRGHYFAELLPGVLLVPLWLLRYGIPRTAAVMAWTPAVLVGLHYGLLPITGRLGLLGLGTTIWYLAGLVLLARGSRIHRRDDVVVPMAVG